MTDTAKLVKRADDWLNPRSECTCPVHCHKSEIYRLVRDLRDAVAAPQSGQAPQGGVAWPEWMRDREKLNDLRQHLVDQGWRQGADGEPEPFDQGACMAAEVCEFVLKLLDAKQEAPQSGGKDADALLREAREVAGNYRSEIVGVLAVAVSNVADEPALANKIRCDAMRRDLERVTTFIARVDTYLGQSKTGEGDDLNDTDPNEGLPPWA